MVTRWKIFVWLFAVTEITRSIQIHEWIWDRDPLGALMLAAGLALALRPGSVRLFLITVGVRLALFASRTPDVHNQEMIETQMLLGVLAVWWFARPSNDEERFNAIAPTIRAGIVAVYAIAVFQKLNIDFFDQDFGCAATLWRTSIERWGLPTALGGLGWAATIGTLAVESALPILLVVRRTRPQALVFALAFHWVVGRRHGRVRILRDDVCLAIGFCPSDWLDQWTPMRSFPVVLATTVGTTGAIAAISVWFTAGARLGVLGWVWWLLLGLTVMMVALRSQLRSHGPLAEPAFWPATLRGPAVIGATLILLNASCPYLGLKTATAIGMYSNLRTEGPHWNHLIVPRAVRIFPFQDRLLAITGSNIPKLQATAENGQLLPRFEVRRQIRLKTAARPDGNPFWVEYQDGDQVFRLERDGHSVRDPQGLLEGSSWLLDRVLSFSRVDAGPRQGCRFDSPFYKPVDDSEI